MGRSHCTIILTFLVLPAGPSIASADYASTVLDDGPIGYWRLGESMGAVAFDASPNNLDGSYVGGVSLGQPGAISTDQDSAALFDGSSGYVDVGTHSVLNQLTNDFTVEAWVKGRGAIVSTRVVAPNTSGFGFSTPVDPGLGTTSQEDSVLRFTTFGIMDYDYPREFSNSEWVHVAAVFDASNDATLFINGLEVATIAGPSPAVANFQPFNIGRNPSDDAGLFFHFSGCLDEVAIYGRSLSSTEISEHYLAAVPEPASCVLAAASLLLLARRLRSVNPTCCAPATS